MPPRTARVLVYVDEVFLAGNNGPGEVLKKIDTESALDVNRKYLDPMPARPRAGRRCTAPRPTAGARVTCAGSSHLRRCTRSPRNSTSGTLGIRPFGPPGQRRARGTEDRSLWPYGVEEFVLRLMPDHEQLTRAGQPVREGPVIQGLSQVGRRPPYPSTSSGGI